jgi:hypothetical protein
VSSLAAAFAPRRFVRLLAGDAMSVARDPMLVFATAMSLLPALALHFAAPAMDPAASDTFGVTQISRYFVPIALVVPAALIGWVTGFLLLEDRDEGTLLALDVTPIGKSGFLAYRVTITAILGAAITLYAWPLILPAAAPAVALALAALVALNAVAAAVVLAALARNKVEGLALTKLTNLLSIVPLLAAIPSPLRHLSGFLPTYWVGELAGLTDVAPLPLPLAVPLALAVNLAVVLLLFRLFSRRVG